MVLATSLKGKRKEFGLKTKKRELFTSILTDQNPIQWSQIIAAKQRPGQKYPGQKLFHCQKNNQASSFSVTAGFLPPEIFLANLDFCLSAYFCRINFAEKKTFMSIRIRGGSRIFSRGWGGGGGGGGGGWRIFKKISKFLSTFFSGRRNWLSELSWSSIETVDRPNFRALFGKAWQKNRVFLARAPPQS